MGAYNVWVASEDIENDETLQFEFFLKPIH